MHRSVLQNVGGYMKFYIYTLGCKVNTYESNVMREVLLNAGYIESEKEKADIIVINTCSVTNTADHKSLKMVHQARKLCPDSILIVTGCSTQNKKEAYEKEGTADIILGNKGKSQIVQYIEEYKKERKRTTAISSMMHASFESMQINHFKGTRAFVKIQDGCNNFCSYCIIPFVRGNVRSKEEELVIEEVQRLVLSGKKEIVLTGIHTGNYGKDKNTSLAHLLKELVKIHELKRIRISSIEVTELTQEFMQVLKDEEKIVNHLHIPLQSGSDFILKSMNRKYNKNEFLEKLQEIRKIRPTISITTDVIVGLPGETEELFQESMDTIRKAQFTKIHVFPYSKREGTHAASMKEQVEEIVKKERVHTLLAISDEMERTYKEKFIGKEVEVLPEVEKEGCLLGHTDNYLEVKYKGSKEDKNKMVKVKIVSLNYPYLEAEKIDEVVSFC